MGGPNKVPIYLDDDEDLPSDTDDEEERLDCVHDIHADADEADVKAEHLDDSKGRVVVEANEDTLLETERPIVHDSSMDGDIEDADGQETERRATKAAPILFNKITGVVDQQSSVDSEQFKQRSSSGKQQFPLTQMRRRQSGSLGQGLHQIQINMSSERPVVASINDSEKELDSDKPVALLPGNKLGPGQNKIKLNAQTINSNSPSYSHLHSDQPGLGGLAEASMRNSHLQQDSSAYEW